MVNSPYSHQFTLWSAQLFAMERNRKYDTVQRDREVGVGGFGEVGEGRPSITSDLNFLLQ